MAGTPEFTRCTLSVSHLANVEAFPIDSTINQTTLHIILDLDPELSVWQADDTISRACVSEGMSVRPTIRVPSASRLVLEATIPSGPGSAGEAARLIAWICDRLSMSDKA